MNSRVWTVSVNLRVARGWLLVLASACSYVPPVQTAPRPATTVNAPFDSTWNAVIDAVARLNLPVATIDRASGLLVPKTRIYLPADSAAALRYADCGHDRSGFGSAVTLYYRRPTSADFNIVVRPAGERSTLNVRVFLKPETCVSTGKLEQEIEDLVFARVRR